MKPRKKLKKKKNDFSPNDEEEIIPTSHDKIGNFNFYSEEVAKEMIELLISLTITTNFRKNTEKKITSFCCEAIIQRLNVVSELFNPNREIDDFVNSEYILSKIKYLKTDVNEKRYKIQLHDKARTTKFFNLLKKNKNKKERVKKEILNKSTTDIYDKDLIRDTNKQYNIEITKYNYWGTISQPQSSIIDRTSSLHNNMSKDTKNILEKITIINDQNKRRRMTLRKKTTIINQNTSIKESNEETDVYNLKPKKKFQPILEMSYVELPNEANKNQENEEIEKMRKETIELIETQKEKMKKLEITMKLNAKKETIKGKYTTDAEGNIVMIKEILPDNLLKDFNQINCKQKELSIGKTPEEIKNEQSLMEKNANKNIIFNKEQKRESIDLFNFNIIPNNNPIINKESEKDENIDVKLNQLSEDPLNPVPLNLSVKKNILEKIVLSGSNFKLINPSTGVNIKEQNIFFR